MRQGLDDLGVGYDTLPPVHDPKFDARLVVEVPLFQILSLDLAPHSDSKPGSSQLPQSSMGRLLNLDALFNS